MTTPFRAADRNALTKALERHEAARSEFTRASFRVAAPPFALPRYEVIDLGDREIAEHELEALRERAEREAAELEDATRRLLDWRKQRRERTTDVAVARQSLRQQSQRRTFRMLVATVLTLATMPFIGRVGTGVALLPVLVAVAIVNHRERRRSTVRCPSCEREIPTPRGILECDACGVRVRAGG